MLKAFISGVFIGIGFYFSSYAFSFLKSLISSGIHHLK